MLIVTIVDTRKDLLSGLELTIFRVNEMYILRIASIISLCKGPLKITSSSRFVYLFGGRVIILSIM